MAHHEILIDEATELTYDQIVIEQVEKFPYTVAKPIFKNGRVCQPGETIHLDRATAARFIELGEVRDQDLH